MTESAGHLNDCRADLLQILDLEQIPPSKWNAALDAIDPFVF